MLAALLGLHWGFLQSVAWLTMIASYSQTTTLPEAVAKTFDGKHPCALCKTIASSRQSGSKSATVPVAKKLEFSYAPTVFIFDAPSAGWEHDPLVFEAAGRLVTPPLPPPRSFPG